MVALARFICILGDHNTSPPDYKSPQTFQSLSTSFTILHSSLSLSLLPPLPPHFFFFFFFSNTLHRRGGAVTPIKQNGGRLKPSRQGWRLPGRISKGVLVSYNVWYVSSAPPLTCKSSPLGYAITRAFYSHHRSTLPRAQSQPMPHAETEVSHINSLNDLHPCEVNHDEPQ